MAEVERLTYSASDLSQQVALMRDEVHASLRGVEAEKASMRRSVQALEEGAQRAVERHTALEARLSNLEREQQSASLSVRSTFARLSEDLRRSDERVAILEFDREAYIQTAQKGASDLREAVRQCHANTEAASVELRQAMQQQGREQSELTTGLRVALSEVSSRSGACEQALEGLRGTLEGLRSRLAEHSRVGQVTHDRLEGFVGRVSKAEEMLQGISAHTGKLDEALRQCRADLKSTISLTCKHGQEAMQDIASLRSQDQAQQRHVDEVSRILDKVCQRGRQCHCDVQDIKTLLHFRGELSITSCSDPRHWTERQLRLWLVDHGLPTEIGQAFETYLVNGLVGKDLSEEDLITMGITDQFLQRRILCELRSLFSPPALGDTGGTKAAQPCHDPAVARPASPSARRGAWPQSARPAAGVPQRSPPGPGSVGRRGVRPSSPAASPGQQRQAQEAASIALASGFRSSPLRPVRRASQVRARSPKSERYPDTSRVESDLLGPSITSDSASREASTVTEPMVTARGEALQGLELLRLRYESL